jgi:hypothetical protein
MDLLAEIMTKLLVYCVAAGIIGGILRLIFGKTLLVTVYFWLIPGIMLTILAAFISGRAWNMDLTWTKLTTPIGVLILAGNFIIVGKKLMGRLQMMSDELQSVAVEMDSSAASASASNQSLADNAASRQQAQGIEEINGAVADMDRITQQNAAAAEESAGASREIGNYVLNAKKIVRDLNLFIKGTEADSSSPSPMQARLHHPDEDSEVKLIAANH